MTISKAVSSQKSRRDGILLTVGFNLRKNDNRCASKSRRDDTTPSLCGEGWGGACVVPAGLWSECNILSARRLKSTVNNVSSLHDFLNCVIAFFTERCIPNGIQFQNFKYPVIQRNKVDFPQPEGPKIAVGFVSGISIERFLKTSKLLLGYENCMSDILIIITFVIYRSPQIIIPLNNSIHLCFIVK
jgi:hypothetical protein